ncbi:hypothetical protein FIV34_12145 [Luteibacter pinisoli]|uniref:MobA/MobL protein domain-containing protein n=1 Tax=Luteibacter pinisoli TaxID=2589080 RepID=A0A4Y5Z5R5_9GAMM|nr:MobA/MobL family protein [Luteibacter pinisoli]QDE39909.1 hypothetical protein FIV34_12145 [Luteibacter pinisoli]
MAEHARPHLHTHNRDKKHSAVAAAAYRLGIKLFDERTEKWHDYSGRAGKAVVFGETIGPKGVPQWLLDPASLWNAVEKAEQRSDAQIARDYRIPIPLGLDEKAAIAMSRSVAGYIVARFNVPVCVAVHRDNSVDLDGKVKPDEKIGFHAHLLFPTRELVREGDGAGDGWMFSRKFTELSNARMSSGVVDAMNEKWARLANRYLTDAGLPATYEYQSYKRLGLDKTPKPVRARKYGEAAEWYKPPRPAGKSPSGTKGAAGLNARSPDIRLDKASVATRLQARRVAKGTRAAATQLKRHQRIAARPIHGKAPLLNRVSFVGGRTLRIDSNLRLSELMRNAGHRPTSDAEQAALERSMFLADLIESLLFAMERARQERGEFAMEMLRRQMAFDDARVRQGIVDRDLRRAEENLQRWLTLHPLRPRLRRPTDEHRRLVEARDRAAVSVERVHASLSKMTEEKQDLVRVEEHLRGNNDKAMRRIRATIEGYKPEFRTVSDALKRHLSDQQKLDIDSLARHLGLDAPEEVTLSRTEAAFPKGTRP